MKIRDDTSPWEYYELASHVTGEWGETLWTSPPCLHLATFASWLYLFADGIRAKLRSVDLFGLRLLEEANKHLDFSELEFNRSLGEERLDNKFVIGVASLIQYCPLAVGALCIVSKGDGSAGSTHGAFSLLRHMISTQIIKTIRSIYRNPKQIDFGSERIVNKDALLTRCRYFAGRQVCAEEELRSLGCADIFGDGQGAWNQGWLCSIASDTAGVCRNMRLAISQADAGDSSDFVSAKAR